MNTPTKPLIYRTPHTFTDKRLVGNRWKIIKLKGQIELVVDVEGLIGYLTEKVAFNTTRRSQLLSGLIQARAVGVEGTLYTEAA
jgi:hypothetical protein